MYENRFSCFGSGSFSLLKVLMLILNLFYALDHSYYLLIIMDAKISTKQHFKRSLSKALIPTLSLCSIKKKTFQRLFGGSGLCNGFFFGQREATLVPGTHGSAASTFDLLTTTGKFVSSLQDTLDSCIASFLNILVAVSRKNPRLGIRNTPLDQRYLFPRRTIIRGQK